MGAFEGGGWLVFGLELSFLSLIAISCGVASMTHPRRRGIFNFSI